MKKLHRFAVNLLFFIDNTKVSLNEIEIKSKTPIYEQVIRLVKSDIELGIFKKGDKIPSINETSAEYGIARDTVEKAYKKLKEEGIIEPIHGKGYFVANTEISNVFRVCLLFNKMSNYKKETYESFLRVLENKAFVDLHIYNFNLKLFERLIQNNLRNYDFFVIIPHFHPGTVGVSDIIKRIPKEKVLIIDKKVNQLSEDYPIVYQDFEKDIFDALEEALPLIRKYKRLILAYRLERFFSIEIKNGFIHFCKAYDIPYEVIDRIENQTINKGDVFVVIGDEDLVNLLKKAKSNNLQLKKDYGIISYNESPMKEILEGGITTISTNHEKIGEEAAQMLLTRNFSKIKVPMAFIKRESL